MENVLIVGIATKGFLKKLNKHYVASKGWNFFNAAGEIDLPLLYNARTYIGLSKGQKYGVWSGRALAHIDNLPSKLKLIRKKAAK